MHTYSHANQDLAWKAILAISSGDLTSLAEAMDQAQKIFNECAVMNCRSELTAPLLNRTINDSSLRPYYLAAKGVGSQGDGCIQFLCASAEQQSQLLSLLSAEPWSYDAFALTIAPSATSTSHTRICSAVVVCGGGEDKVSCGEGSAEDSLTNFLLELIACGIRNLTLLCLGDCHGVCHELHRSTSSSAPLPSPWLYSDSKLRHLSSYLSFRSISSKAEFETDLHASLEEILRFHQRDGEEANCDGVPVFLSSVRHSSLEARESEIYSSRAVYGMLRGEREQEGTRVRGGLTISFRIMTLVDPEKDTLSFANQAALLQA
jgi:hypothetical protein